ncbi:MAG: M36 family metallopeptidase, partial [Saprospiraceae bacterium]|nr:M36 family metallopeptidase [Saprospiraceae bacterium]
AVGFIICNFEESLVTMGGGAVGDQVTIPGVFISNSDCQKIRVFVESGLTVSFVNESAGTGPNRRAASFDNGIIAHEFGHGISNRLTGGPGASGCLHLYDTDNDGSSDDGEQMGEGWSDFFTLVTSVHAGDNGSTPRGIATYSAGQEITGGGIRPFPYTTNMAVNPMTYDDIAFYSIPHGVGTVWCTMLWDLYWAFVDTYGFDPDMYTGTGGNNMAIQLVMDGLKMQTCEPGFVDGRDAILAADRALYGGANQQLIWEVFARRGLGYSAKQGEDRFRRDGAEAFDIDPRVVKELKVVKHMTPFIEPGDPITIDLMVVNHRDEDATQVIVTDAIPDGTTYINGSSTMASDLAGNAIAFEIDTVGAGDTLAITYQVQSSASLFSESIFVDDMENGIDNWDLIITEDPINYVIWSLQEFVVHNGNTAWAAENLDTNMDQSIITLDRYLLSGDQPLLVFYQNVDVEKFFDAGILQISDDGGLTWATVGEDKLIRGQYLSQVQYSLFAIPNIRAWSGNTNGWEPVVVDLSDYLGEEIKLRFRFASDLDVNSVGWFIDDIEIMDAFNYNSTACITSAEGDGICAEAVERGTIVASSEVSATGDLTDTDFDLRALMYPDAGKEAA